MHVYVKKERSRGEGGRVHSNQTDPSPSCFPLPSLHTHHPSSPPYTGNHTGALAIYQGRYKRFAKNPPPTQQTALAFEVGIC